MTCMYACLLILNTDILIAKNKDHIIKQIDIDNVNVTLNYHSLVMFWNLSKAAQEMYLSILLWLIIFQ